MGNIVLISLQIIAVFVSIYGVIKLKTKALLFLPIYVILFDVIYGFYQAGSGLGTIRNLSLFIFIVFLIIIKKDILSHNKWMTLFLLYILLLVPLSSDMENSAVDYICVFVSLMCLPAGFYFIRNVKDLRILNSSMLVLAIIFVLNSLLSSVFNLGIDYYGGGIKLGGFVASKLFSPALYIVLLPIIIPLLGKRMRILAIIIAVFVFIFLLLSMRRTSVFIPVFGYMLYFLFSRRKVHFIAISAIFVVMLLALFPFYQKVLELQFQTRRETFDNPSLENEYRYKETVIIYKEVFASTKSILIGKEIFNSSGNYYKGRWGDRPIHIDYNLILHGAGMIGLILYFLTFYDIISKYFRYQNAVPEEDYFYELKNMFKILVILCLIVSLNGGITQISYRAVLFLYIGSLLGIFHKYFDNKSALDAENFMLNQKNI
ncbi:MAG: hypothetical protein JW830_03135 [Bacteroidales bacterium]|nr:hypothetical protein [Bacteroidales bacterium]